MMRSIMMLVLGLNVVTSFSSKIPKFSVRSTSNNLKMTSSFYDIVEKDANGEAVKFDKFKGKVLYGVNVASKCGYTASGYALLSKVSKIPGVEVALFPCNQFLGQEPGSDADVANFCVLKGVEGPNVNVFTKGDVNGANTRPTYKFLKDKGVLGNVKWNFAGKFIVDKEGNVLPLNSDQDVEPTITKLTAK